MLAYSFPLLMLFISNLSQFIDRKKLELVILLVSSFVVAIFIGLRWFCDTDYEGYFLLYESIPSLKEFDMSTAKELYGEIGYLLFNSLFRTIGLPFVFVTIVASLFSIGVKSFFAYSFCKYSFFALTLYLCLHFITTEFSELRWSIATSFILLGYLSLYNNNKIYAILFFFISLLFHYFSLVGIILFVSLYMPKRRHYYLLFLICIFAAIVYKLFPFRIFIAAESDIYIVSKIIRYFNNPLSNVGFFSILKMTLYPISFLIFRKLSSLGMYGGAFLYLERLSLVFISAALLLSFLPVFFLRLAPLADFFSILALVHVLDFVRARASRSVLFILISTCFGCWFLIALSNSLSVPLIDGGLAKYDSWLTFIKVY